MLPCDDFDYTQNPATPTNQDGSLDQNEAKALFCSMDINPTMAEQGAAFYAQRRQAVWPARDLSWGLRALLWALRLYVLVMLALVVMVLRRAAG